MQFDPQLWLTFYFILCIILAVKAYRYKKRMKAEHTLTTELQHQVLFRIANAKRLEDAHALAQSARLYTPEGAEQRQKDGYWR